MPDEQNTAPAVDFDYISLDCAISGVTATPEGPSEFSQRIRGKIFAVRAEESEGADPRVEIGEVTAILIRIGQALEAEWDVLTTLDAHSGETWDCTALFGDDDYTEQVQEMFPEAIWLGDILLVTNMEIKPEYRGHDAGLIAMRAVINMFSGGCSLVVCKPFPLQYTSKVTAANRKEFRIAERKLRKYWVKAGFKRVPGTDMYALSVA